MRPAAPRFHDAGHGSDRARGASEFVEFGHEPVNLVCGCQAFSQDRVGDVLHGEGVEQLYFAFASSRLDDIHAHILKAGLMEQRRQAGTDIRIRSSSPHSLSVKLYISPERGGVWVTKMAAEINVLNHDDAAAPKGLAHPCQGSTGVGQVSEQ